MTLTQKSNFTYVVSTLLGIVRLQSRDIDGTNPINTDDEVAAMIMMTGSTLDPNGLWDTTMLSTIFLSAANCFDLMARDAAKVALIEKIGALSDNTKVTYDALREEADLLRTRAIQGFVPDPDLFVPAGQDCKLDFVPFSLPIRWVGWGVTEPASTLDRW